MNIVRQGLCNAFSVGKNEGIVYPGCAACALGKLGRGGNHARLKPFVGIQQEIDLPGKV